MSKITNDGLTRSRHNMLYSFTRMASAGVKGLILRSLTSNVYLPA